MNGIKEFINFIISRRMEILTLIGEHIGLTLISVVLAILVGVPLGILITRKEKLATPILGIANVVQAIPSLALLGFLIPVLGIGSKPAVIMVFLYSLLPILKNTYTGIKNINSDMKEAAKAMGMTRREMLVMVELPLALPVIMAGVRISAVTAVGLMTIAAFVGAGGLGYMVFSGVQTVNNYMILAGAIPACILALLMDFIISKIEYAVTPRGISKNKKSSRKTLKNKKVYKFAAVILVIALILGGFKVFSGNKKKIVVGSKNYNEQLILGNMLATLIEENSDIKVERKMNLGGSSVTFSAFRAKELDMYVEYTGTALVNIMKEPAINDADEAYNKVKRYFSQEYNGELLKPLGFNNTYTLAVRKDTAEKYNLENFSDLAKVSNDLILGSTIEFLNREDGYLGLKKAYNMNFKDTKALDGGLRYSSINSDKAQVTDAFYTDGLLKAFDLKVLKDDKNFFPPYYAFPVIRKDTLKKYPEIEGIVNKLAGKLDEDTMRELNYKVDKLNQEPRKVAEDFLREQNLIKN